MQGGKSQPQGHNRSQDIGHSPQGCDRTEKCTQAGTQSHPHKHTVRCTRTVSHPKMQPTSPHRAGAKPLGEATGGLGLVGSVHEPLACRLQVGLNGLAWWSLQSLPTGEQPRGTPGSLWASALGS